MAVTIIAHRGASGYAPENTRGAFDRALGMDADWLECDVRLCKSGELILMHDSTINRTTNGEGRVSRLTYKQVKKYKTADNQKVLSLEEFFVEYKDKAKLMVDVKSVAAAPALVKLIQQYKLHHQVAITSTMSALLLDVLIRDPQIKTQIAFDFYSYLKYILFHRLFVLPARLVGADTVNIHYRFVNQKIVDHAHKFHLKINAFPVNGLEHIAKMKNFGVDGIITNYPDRVKN